MAVSVLVSLPVAPACVLAEESAVLPAAPSVWAVACPSEETDAPAPFAVPSECYDELDTPPPAVEWLSELPLADAANAGVIGLTDSMRASALVESTKPNFSRLSIKSSDEVTSSSR